MLAADGEHVDLERVWLLALVCAARKSCAPLCWAVPCWPSFGRGEFGILLLSTLVVLQIVQQNDKYRTN